MLREYASIINDQLDSGVIEKVVELERGEKVHYLPHQAVIRKEATTTKVRIVYYASSKEKKSGTSLNDCLHVGPSLNPLLYDILLRFCENRIVLERDIACVQTITKLLLVPSAKQRRDPCSGPQTDSMNYRKCVSNSPST